jgi:hypothetical protein
MYHYSIQLLRRYLLDGSTLHFCDEFELFSRTVAAEHLIRCLPTYGVMI